MAPEPRDNRPGGSPGAARVTLGAALVPGAGHWLLGRRREAGGLFAIQALGLSAVLMHVLGPGLPPFETHLGSFLLAVLMRSLATLHAFSVIDAYFFAIDPLGEGAPPLRRRAAAANLILPGAGYLLARAWVRASVGLMLLVLFAYFAQAGTHPYLDPIFMAMQALMAATAYRQVRMLEQEQAQARLSPGEPLPLLPVLRQVQTGQVTALLVAVMALVFCGWVMERRLPPGAVTGLGEADIKAEQREDGVYFSVGPLGLTMKAVGPGWSLSPWQAGTLFQAVHGDEAMVRVGLQLMPAFTHPSRVAARLRQMSEAQGYVFQKSIDRDLNGQAAFQQRFAGRGDDFWTIAVPRDRYAVVMMLGCRTESCPALEAQLQQTVDSLRFKSN